MMTRIRKQNDVLIVGAGRVGMTIARLLRACPEFGFVPTLIDLNGPTNKSFPVLQGDLWQRLDVVGGFDAVINAAPIYDVEKLQALVTVCVEEGTHYFDLSEDTSGDEHIERIVANAASYVVPHCGVAPGFTTILGGHLVSAAHHVDELLVSCGALSLFPAADFRHAVTWSAEGLVHEYLSPSKLIHDGKLIEVRPFRDEWPLETMQIESSKYEAFPTSGGLGTLITTLAERGDVDKARYRSIRQPGHFGIMKTLMRTHEFDERSIVGAIRKYEDSHRDYVLVDGVVTGTTYECPASYRRSFRFDISDYGSAIASATAAGILSTMWYVLTRYNAPRSFVLQERIRFDEYLQSPFFELVGLKEIYA